MGVMIEPELAYAEGAYTPDRRRRRPERECRHSRKFRTFAAGGERLAHRAPSVDISPMHDWQHNTPKALRKREADPAMARLETPEYRVDQSLRWDEECIRFTSHIKRAFFIGIAKLLGLIGGGLITVCSFILTIAMAAMYANEPRHGGFFINFFQYSGWDFPLYPLAISLVMWGGRPLYNASSPTSPLACSPAPCGS